MSAPRRLTYANVASTLALVVALTGGGAAIAAGLGKNTVGSLQLKNGQVKRVDLARDSVDSAKLRSNSVRGPDVAEATLDQVPEALQAMFAVSAQTAARADNVLAAVVDANGNLINAQSQSAVNVFRTAPGRYEVQFNRVITDCAYVGTLGLAGAGGVPAAGFIGVVGVAGAGTDRVFVATRDEAGANADRAFHLAVIC